MERTWLRESISNLFINRSFYIKFYQKCWFWENVQKIISWSKWFLERMKNGNKNVIDTWKSNLIYSWKLQFSYNKWKETDQAPLLKKEKEKQNKTKKKKKRKKKKKSTEARHVQTIILLFNATILFIRNWFRIHFKQKCHCNQIGFRWIRYCVVNWRQTALHVHTLTNLPHFTIKWV